LYVFKKTQIDEYHANKQKNIYKKDKLLA